MPAEPFDAVRRFVEALDRLDIPYAITGSFASSIYGAYRLSADCDLVARLRAEDVEPLSEMLRDEFYADREMMLDALARQRSFNVIHLEAAFKIDVFITGSRPYDPVQMERRVRQPFSPEFDAWFVSPEDCILSKLEWYRSGQEISDRQWIDILGVIKVQADRLDLGYLRRWAAELELEDLLERALLQARQG